MLFHHDQEILAADASLVGAKAWNLAQLKILGFNVPSVMSIPATVYQAWIVNSGLQSTLYETANRLVNDAPVMQALETLRATLIKHPLPEVLINHLKQCFENQDAAISYAVRSSSPQEDSNHASFAGIHASYLNIKNLDALQKTIIDVWLSLWTPTAIFYRHKMNIKQEDASMAVLIMPLIKAKASGIAFTADPVSGRKDHFIIHANWGLGESLVEGKSTGDEIRFLVAHEQNSLILLDYHKGEKKCVTMQDEEGGTTQTEQENDLANACVFTVAQALKLAEMIYHAAVALDFSNPYFDCEWVWDGDKFWIVQARPITTQARFTYPELQQQPDIWSRGNTRDVMPYPLLPIDWSAAQTLPKLLLEEGLKQAGFKILQGTEIIRLFDGHFYLNMSVLQWQYYDAYGLLPAQFNQLVGGHHGEIKLPNLTFKKRLARFKYMVRYLLSIKKMQRLGRKEAILHIEKCKKLLDQAIPKHDEEIASMWRQFTNEAHQYHGLFFMQGSGGANLSMLSDWLNKYFPGEGYALTCALMAGGKENQASVTAQQTYDLIRIAKIMKSDPDASAWFNRFQTLSSNLNELPKENPFRLAFESFLEKYGHRASYETYISHPRWRENPAFLLNQLPDLAHVDLEIHASKIADQVAFARKRVLTGVPFLQRWRLNIMVRLAQQESNDRELARSSLMAGIEPVRHLLLYLGKQWVNNQWIAKAEDIFMLTSTEILNILDKKRHTDGLQALIGQRHHVLKKWQILNEVKDGVPEVILTHLDQKLTRDDYDSSQKQMLTRSSRKNESSFKGVCVGSGQIVGRVCLLRSPLEGEKLKRGDILVVPSTDPSWTPLFMKAGGLIMETGGFLSHGAIVAREFGIPAVVNLPGIMNYLQDGDLVNVDAGAAMITLLKKHD